MISLFASIAGFISSLIPELVKILKDKNDKKHELEIMDKQIAISKMKLSQSLDEIRLTNDQTEFSTLYNTYKSGVNWIDTLNGSVRPVMAYSFFILYALLKYVQLKAVLNLPGSIAMYIDIIWSSDDQAIFAGIISFYFGQRTFSKLWRQK